MYGLDAGAGHQNIRISVWSQCDLTCTKEKKKQINLFVEREKGLKNIERCKSFVLKAVHTTEAARF
jgi:hypothetical protein